MKLYCVRLIFASLLSWITHGIAINLAMRFKINRTDGIVETGHCQNIRKRN